MKSWRNSFLGLGLVVLLTTSQGCAVLALGAAGGAAGYAIATGAAAKNYDQPLEYVYQAAHRALADMKAEIIIDDFGAMRTQIHAEDITGRNIRVDIDALTDQTSRVRVRVGNIGSKEAAMLIIDTITGHLYLR